MVDWNKDGKVACNVTDMSKEERDLLTRRKKGKKKAEKDAEELIGKLPSWEVPFGLPPVSVAGESNQKMIPPNVSTRTFDSTRSPHVSTRTFDSTRSPRVSTRTRIDSTRSPLVSTRTFDSTRSSAPDSTRSPHVPTRTPDSDNSLAPNPRYWPEDILDRIREVISTPCEEPKQPKFCFELTAEAAEKNFCVLKSYNLDLEAALADHRSTLLGYCSEFRPVSQLEPIFSLHPNWPHWKRILQNGSDWPLAELDNESRAMDLDEALAFGNHKGANQKPELLRDLIQKDIKHGYGLVIPLKKIKRFPEAILAPMNIAKQNTIDECGHIIGKDRLTHDQSWKWTVGASVNSRVDKETLIPCRFGHALRRIVNWAVAARHKFPGRRILATKVDCKSAYRRCHLSAKTAIQTCTQLPAEDLAIIALRLTFGGAPCPYEWGATSETICDLAIHILQHVDWNPLNLHAPNQHLLPAAETLDDNISFGEGKELIIDVPVDPKGVVDVYIDDTLGLTVEEEGSDNIMRLERAILLAIYVASRPKDANEPIPREEMAALNKLIAEAGLEEEKTILGWFFNFRKLLISLPENKYTAWSDGIKEMMEEGKAKCSDLETLVGRLTHLSMVIPGVNHFLSRLRDLHIRSKNRRSIKISDVCMADLDLMLFFLGKAKLGIDMNLLSYRRPTHIYRSDSCPAGLGGYSCEGWAWRYYLPEHLKSRASNNLLEHIGSIITPWVDIINNRLVEGDCALSMTDSSTSEGWNKKTNFSEMIDDPIQATIRIEVCRGHAMRMLERGIRDYSQWFPGVENDVSDALSLETTTAQTKSLLTFFANLSLLSFQSVSK